MLDMAGNQADQLSLSKRIIDKKKLNQKTACFIKKVKRRVILLLMRSFTTIGLKLISRQKALNRIKCGAISQILILRI